jgi:hypothetical protein
LASRSRPSPPRWRCSPPPTILIGFSAAATFAPLVADVSHWFEKRRGVAVAIAASGNYIAGAIWPPIVELMIRDYGWRRPIFPPPLCAWRR